MKNRELQQDSISLERREHTEFNVFLPNEGMLMTHKLFHVSEIQFGDEFWLECCGLPVAVGSVETEHPCFYTQEEIQNNLDLIRIPEDSTLSGGNDKKLKKFWYDPFDGRNSWL
jgi:hypothetical protein